MPTDTQLASGSTDTLRRLSKSLMPNSLIVVKVIIAYYDLFLQRLGLVFDLSLAGY
jgi:hypothetical protein